MRTWRNAAERHFAEQAHIEVVLIGADSLDTVRGTHANEFDGAPGLRLGADRLAASSSMAKCCVTPRDWLASQARWPTVAPAPSAASRSRPPAGRSERPVRWRNSTANRSGEPSMGIVVAGDAAGMPTAAGADEHAHTMDDRVPTAGGSAS